MTVGCRRLRCEGSGLRSSVARGLHRVGRTSLLTIDERSSVSFRAPVFGATLAAFEARRRWQREIPGRRREAAA
jgi:hypothetical protein